MENTKTFKMNINDLIALCHIVDKFEEFNEQLIKLMSVKNKQEIRYNLLEISTGKKFFGSNKEKKFYHQNKFIIDKINEYSNIGNFISYNYDSNESFNCNSSLLFFYQYILNHKEKLEEIIILLQKLKELGFDKLEFNEDKDFTKKQYNISPGFIIGDVIYLDNIEIIPNYQDGVIEYKTTGSNYKMIINYSCNLGNRIVVNSLLFDTKRLPENITKDFIVARFKKLNDEHKEKSMLIKNSVDLSVSIEDLHREFNSTYRIIEGLDDIKSKSELLSNLLKIKEYLNKLETISSEYNDSISSENPSLTKEKLDTEKKLYLRRRESSKYDLD